MDDLDASTFQEPLAPEQEQQPPESEPLASEQEQQPLESELLPSEQEQQWLEHPTRSQRVVGSNPIWGSDFFRVLQTFNLSCVCCFIFNGLKHT